MKIINDNMVYIMNSGALGDTIAALPVLKYAIDNHHKDGSNYNILMESFFKVVYHSFDQSKLLDIREKNTFKNNSCFKILNEIQRPNLPPTPTRLSPLRVSLTDYASVAFLEKILSIRDKNYLSWNLDADLSKFNIDFSKAVCIACVSSTDVRKFDSEEIKILSRKIIKHGLIPIYIGTDHHQHGTQWKVTDGEGINLINKTTINECANIIKRSQALIGLDSGLMHLAGMTETPIVAAYTTVNPLIRLPIRHNKIGWNCEAVIPDIECQFCQSDYIKNNFIFTECMFNTNLCCKQITANKLFSALTRLLENQ